MKRWKSAVFPILIGIFVIAIIYGILVCPITIPGFLGYRIRLTNGYDLVCVHSGSVGLSSQTGYGIEPNIDGYRFRGSLVIGHVTKQDSMSKPGYFIVDTKTRERHQALTKDKWIEMLKDYGVTKAPRLVRPTGLSEQWARF